MAVEKTVFMEFFGDYPLIRVLDFLIENDAFDYSKKEICEQAEVSWNTLETFWGRLEDNGIVVKTRKVGKSEMYKLNTGNAVVKKLIEIDKQLTLESLEDVKEEEAADKALEAAEA